jgi:alpha-L-fucosidase 2
MRDVTRREAITAGAVAAATLASRCPAVAAPAAADDRSSRLWYRQPAATWTEALPIGNGRQGAMVFGGVATERLQLNADTLYAGGPYQPANPEAHGALDEVRRLVFAGHYREAEALINARMMARPLKQMPYQTAGDLLFDLPAADGGAVTGYERELDLDKAVTRVTFARGGIRHVREALATPVDGVIALRFTVDRPGALELFVSLRPEQQGKIRTVGNREIIFAGHNASSSGVDGRLALSIRARVIAPGAVIQAQGARLHVRGASEVLILVALDTSYRRYDDVSADSDAATAATIDRASQKEWKRLRDAHVAEHRRLFRRMTITLGRTAAADKPTDERIRAIASAESLAADPDLAALYHQFGRYLLIASSRPGSQPANLQGIWNDSNQPPWDSKYTININTQMNYWPAEPTGLAECVEPLVRMVEELAATGATTARVMYGARGWVAHHNTDLWRATA